MKDRDLVVVFKDKKSREITTYVNPKGHGAHTDLNDFLSLLADKYGNPAATMTKAGHLVKLKAAAAEVIHDMKAKTVGVAVGQHKEIPKQT